MRSIMQFLMPLVACCAVMVATGCASGGADDDEPTADAAGPGTPDAPTGGQCSFCSATESCCSGFCIDTQSNRNNCGGCNEVCPELTSNGCSGGSCVCNFGPACVAPQECCDTGCKNIETDRFNCGGCGIQCGPNESCVGSMCVCAGSGTECAPGEECCETGCVNTQGDPLNCGGCGISCGESATCSMGGCLCDHACPPGALVPGCCADGCFDLCSDSANCGACGAPCESCIFGVCLDTFPPPEPLPECLALPM